VIESRHHLPISSCWFQPVPAVLQIGLYPLAALGELQAAPSEVACAVPGCPGNTSSSSQRQQRTQQQQQTVPTLPPVATVRLPGKVSSIAFCPDMQGVLSIGDYDGTLTQVCVGLCPASCDPACNPVRNNLSRDDALHQQPQKLGSMCSHQPAARVVVQLLTMPTAASYQAHGNWELYCLVLDWSLALRLCSGSSAGPC